MVETYVPTSLTDALKYLQTHSAIVFAGGSDLMVRYKSPSGCPINFDQNIVYISRLNTLKGIELSEGTLLIQAGTTVNEMIHSDVVPDFIKSVCREIASEAIRNLATMGGNICNASPAGDFLPVLYALNAELELMTYESKRVVAIQDFIVGPKKTILQPNELLTQIRIPIKACNGEAFNSFYYRKLGQRKSNAISKCSILVLAFTEFHCIKDIRIAFGAVSPSVVRARQLERLIYENPNSYDEQLFESLIRETIHPVDDLRSVAEYRSEVMVNLFNQFMKSLIKGDREGEGL